MVFEGRTDSQIKIRGHRVDLTEVEKAVVTIDGIDKGTLIHNTDIKISHLIYVYIIDNLDVYGLSSISVVH